MKQENLMYHMCRYIQKTASSQQIFSAIAAVFSIPLFNKTNSSTSNKRIDLKASSSS